MHYGHIKHKEEIIDEVLVSIMKSPRTFTKEDVVEINCHGGISSTNKILETLLTNGCRLAEPGEFTKRAFLNGRIDLVNAESIMNMINAENDSARRVAMKGIDGYLSKKIKNIRQTLLELLASIEVNIDYPEYEDAIDMTINEVLPEISKIKKDLELLIEKSDSSFLLVLCVALIIMAILSRNATWLQWVLLIPTGAMLINSIVSLKKQKKPEPLKEYPFVSIFIPAHNEEFTIEDTIRSVCQIDYHNEEGEPQYELIVVNDGSTDSTGEILSRLKSEFPQLKIVTRHPPRSGKGKGFVLNDALTLSRGEIIGVFDADTQIKPDYLKKVIPYIHDDIEGVQTRVKMFNKNENFLARMQHVEFTTFANTLIAKDNLDHTGFLGGNGQFVRKQAIIDSGRWDGFAVTEDLNLAIKIILNGGKISYCGDCAVYQEAVTDWKAFFRQRTRWAIGNFETLFVYFPQILRSKISITKKFNVIEHISFYSFNLLIFFGFIITILNAISWFFFHNVTLIRMEAPFIVGILSAVAFFPGIIFSLARDKLGFFEAIKDIVKYYIYCFHLIPLFFLTMYSMMSRKERKWSKTVHKGGKK